MGQGNFPAVVKDGALKFVSTAKNDDEPIVLTPSNKDVIDKSCMGDDWVTSQLDEKDVPLVVSRHMGQGNFPAVVKDGALKLASTTKNDDEPIVLTPSNKDVIDKSCMGDDWVTSQLDEKDVPLVVSRHMGKGNVPAVVKDGALQLTSSTKNDDEPIVLSPSNKDVIDKSCMGDDWVTSQLDEKDVPLVVSRHMGKGNIPAVVKDGALKLASTAKNDDEPIVLSPSNKDVLDKSCMGDDWVTSQLDEKDVPLVVSRHMGKGNVPAVVKDGALKFAAKGDDSQLSKDAAKSGVKTADEET
jgi:peptidyl-tRNA hydrolase